MSLSTRIAFYIILSLGLLSLLSTTISAAPSSALSERTDDVMLEPRDKVPKAIKKFLDKLKKPPPMDEDKDFNLNDYYKGEYDKKASKKAGNPVYKFESACRDEQILQLENIPLRRDRFFDDYNGWVHGVDQTLQDGLRIRARVSKRVKSESDGYRFLLNARRQQNFDSNRKELVLDYFWDTRNKVAVVVYALDSPSLLWSLGLEDTSYETYLEILEAVLEAHEDGLYHNDINDQNILRLVGASREDGEVRVGLTNFDMASTQGEKSGVLGTQFYAPIEIVHDKESWVPAEVDMWELGMVGLFIYVGPWQKPKFEAIWTDLVQDDKELSPEDSEAIIRKHGVTGDVVPLFASVLCHAARRLTIHAYRDDIQDMGKQKWEAKRMG
ncbi:kinase-like protein [Penicillium capsulatum]|uniref:Kinase-like protein n=1 Tax=Penicillium capsulatum TaxID=69766 RepID=A0A9W9I3A0_9EURO|nr:kinase-like protein [Penicillium capsulatum]KAJ6108940.1 kinase-like protein [Penicillium capsulatum]